LTSIKKSSVLPRSSVTSSPTVEAAKKPTQKTTPAAAPASSPAADRIENRPGKPVVEINPARLERPSARTSRLAFDIDHPDIQKFVKSHGWDQPGYNLSAECDRTKMVYTTDAWHTKNEVKLQFLHNGQKGFILRDVPPGAQIKYAIEVSLAQSHNQFRYFDRRETFWINNDGKDYLSVTQSID